MDIKERPWTLPIVSLRPGMAIDLEALVDWLDLDDCPSCQSIRMEIEYEFAIIDAVDREANGTVILSTSQGCFALPGDIIVLVQFDTET